MPAAYVIAKITGRYEFVLSTNGFGKPKAKQTKEQIMAEAAKGASADQAAFLAMLRGLPADKRAPDAPKPQQPPKKL